MGWVALLARYPVKGAAAERLDAAVLEPDGVQGDRVWACVDAGDGTIASLKHPHRWAGLLQVRAATQPGGMLIVRICDRVVTAGTAQADEVLSSHLQRQVRLTRVVPEQPRAHRLMPRASGMIPDWMTALTCGQETVTAVSGARPGGRFLDFGAVHLVSAQAVEQLARLLDRPTLDPLRFRPNIVLDGPPGLDLTPGTLLRAGQALLRVQVPTPRCVVPGLDPGPAEPVAIGEDPASPAIDQPLLEQLGRSYRVPLDGLGTAACFGVYAEVVTPGAVEVGAAVSVHGP